MDALPPQIGRYEIKRRIGQGGMGTLYLANDPNTHRLVALKLLSPTLNSTEFRQRFVREVRALAALSHPNIVSAYDAGEFEGALYFVMEFVDGETLSALIRQRTAMTVPQKLKLMTELCAGLAQAHAAGIIHRDIKPANLMVDRQGRLKILDFGIARVVESRLSGGNEGLTLASMAIGTPGYMAPEQIEGREIDRRTDVFAAGAVCHELFSYDVALSGRNAGEIERQTSQAQAASLASLVTGIDPEIDRIVSRALNRDPDRRYQDAATLGQALEGVRLRLDPGAARPASFVTRPDQIEATMIIRSPVVPAATHPARTIVSTPVGAAARPPAPAETIVRPAVRPPSPPNRPAPPPETIVRPPVSAPSRPMPSSETIVGLPPLGVSGRPMPSAETMIGVPAGAPRRPSESAETMLARPVPERPTPRDQPPRKDPRAPSKPREPLWTRYRQTALVLAALVIVAGLGLAGLGLYNLLTTTGHTLTITKPTGGTLSAPGIKCGTGGTDCSSTPAEGEMVELLPEPDAGFLLEGYTGDCAPGGRTQMTAPRTCGATFVAVAVTEPTASQRLTISPVPTGGTLKGVDITCGTQGAVCLASFAHGVPVELRPEADPDYTFMGFTGDCRPLGRLQMTSPRTCGADFTLTSSLKISPNPPPTPPAKPNVPNPTPSGQPSAAKPSVVQPPQPSTPGTPTAPGQPVTTVDPAPPGADQKPAAPPISDDDFARQRILQTLTAYCKGIEAFDPVAVQKVYPKANMEGLRRQLDKGKYKSVECTFGEPKYSALDASPAGNARLTAEYKAVFEHRHQQDPDIHESIADIRLSRAEVRSPFLMDSITFKPKPKK